MLGLSYIYCLRLYLQYQLTTVRNMATNCRTTKPLTFLMAEVCGWEEKPKKLEHDFGENRRKLKKKKTPVQLHFRSINFLLTIFDDSLNSY